MPSLIICITVVNFSYLLAKSVPQVYGLPYSSSPLIVTLNQFLLMLVQMSLGATQSINSNQTLIFFDRLQRHKDPTTCMHPGLLH